jgi:hypothetical protein
MNTEIPPIPEGFTYAGQLKDHEGEVFGIYWEPRMTRWSEYHPEHIWYGMKGVGGNMSGEFHIAIPNL